LGAGGQEKYGKTFDEFFKEMHFCKSSAFGTILHKNVIALADL
jgi:hypothetical protein